eukprot:Plantae.Rhodophyta-Rhodochaete_pulchella.ctg10127.p1 GENE.Plantae.Rhodophyta-Rhodochaete_pulchella.ctg10127~~Plantae.Rhodophyta-Rhodochaete_pulchella.ctg10127.p1  ORF type:complete len:605 (-),score=82.54 Plantae.Rhodophyta-Rhodochaete_pulchella.ctg10127:62-1840(-)
MNHVVNQIARSFGFQMLHDGFFNGDPHPGNILVALDSKGAARPVLLDFGLTKCLDEDSKLALASMLCAAASSDLGSLLQAFDDLGLKIAPSHHNMYSSAMEMTQFFFRDSKPVNEARLEFRNNARKRSKQFEENRIRLRQDKSLRRNPVDAFPECLIFFSRALFLIRGLASRLAVRQKYLEILRPYAEESLRVRAMRETGPQSSRQLNSLESSISSVLRDFSSQGLIAGAQASVWQAGRPIASVSIGERCPFSGAPVTPNTLFNVFSCSKAITATALHILIDRGLVDLDEPVCKYWLTFKKPKVLVRHLLRHQAGLDSAGNKSLLDGPFGLIDWDGMKTEMEIAETAWEPGSQSVYHAASFGWLVGVLVECVTRVPFPEFVRENILQPFGLSGEVFLGMTDREYANAKSRFATLSIGQGWPIEAKAASMSLLGETTAPAELFPTFFNYGRVRRACVPAANGHASADGLAKFYTALIGAADARGASALISSEALAKLRERQSNTTFGLGLCLYDSDPSKPRSDWVGHGGLGGSLGCAHVPTKLAIAVTVNQLNATPTCAAEVVKHVCDQLDVPMFDISEGSDFLQRRAAAALQ